VPTSIGTMRLAAEPLAALACERHGVTCSEEAEACGQRRSASRMLGLDGPARRGSSRLAPMVLQLQLALLQAQSAELGAETRGETWAWHLPRQCEGPVYRTSLHATRHTRSSTDGTRFGWRPSIGGCIRTGRSPEVTAVDPKQELLLRTQIRSSPCGTAAAAVQLPPDAGMDGAAVGAGLAQEAKTAGYTGDQGFLVHTVSRFDTLAGLAIRYGVQVGTGVWQ